MKMISCDLCNATVILGTQFFSHCNCLDYNISGKYQENGVYADIYLKDESSLYTSRVIGINNSLLFGMEKRAICHIGEWNDYQLFVYINGVQIKQHCGSKTKYTSEDVGAGIIALMNRVGKSIDDVSYIDKDKKIYFTDNSYILCTKQKDVDDFICVYVEKNGKYLFEGKLIRYEM